MALGLNKIVLSGNGVNVPGAYLQYTQVSANNATVVIPAGLYIMFPTANVTIESVSAYNTNTACTTPATWSTWLANNTGGLIISDGTNTRANVIVAPATTITLSTVNGGTAVTGTFNS